MDAEHEGGRRRAAVDVLVNLQHRRRAHRVGGVAAVAFGHELRECKRRLTRQVGINEQGQFTPIQVECVFDLELEIGEAFDAGKL